METAVTITRSRKPTKEDKFSKETKQLREKRVRTDIQNAEYSEICKTTNHMNEDIRHYGE